MNINDFDTKRQSPSTGSADYDFQKLRKKLLQNWGNEKENDPVIKTEDMPKTSAENPPVKKKIKVIKKVLKSKPQEAVVTTSPLPVRNESIGENANHKVMESKKAKSMQNKNSAKKLPVDLKDGFRQWLIYDTIFGEPRSKKRWSPIK